MVFPVVWQKLAQDGTVQLTASVVGHHDSVVTRLDGEFSRERAFAAASPGMR
nr:hypothetical protein [Nonomuraea gerenzanensis]